MAVPTGKPDAPYNLSATGGDCIAIITFTAGSDHGNAITNYLYSTNGVDYIALDPADAASPITVPGLTNGEAVSVRLKARNSVGDSPPSEPVLILPRVIPVPIPYWMLGFLVGLMSWLGYRRLKLAQQYQNVAGLEALTKTPRRRGFLLELHELALLVTTAFLRPRPVLKSAP